MTRLINADAIEYSPLDDIYNRDVMVAFKESIENMPTVDAEPVRHGKWIIRDNPGTGWYRITCSECGEDVTSTAPCIGFFPNAKVAWDYCPVCGAKMDGEDEQPSSEDCDQISEFVMERLKAEKTLERLGQILGEVFGKINETIDDCCNEFLKEEEKKNETE